MNINLILTNFAQQELVISRNDIERDRIKTSIDRLKKNLKNNLGDLISDFITFGSYTRNTILPRMYDLNSDIDIMVICNTKNGTKTPETYRKNLLNVLQQTYPNSISRKDFPAVKLELNHIKFDIVPAYREDYVFMLGRYYYIPDSLSNWRTTIPNDLNETLGNKNQSFGNNIIRNTIRLCKHWNASSGYPFESYLMEEEILRLGFWGTEDLYSCFLYTLKNIAGNFAGVNQALEYINQYKGNFFNAPNEAGQLRWLQKLLPGLKL